MAGYSGTPLWKKLGLKPDQTWVIVNAPAEFEIEDAPCQQKNTKSVPKNFDGIVVFTLDLKSLDKAMSKAVENMYAEASVWIAWPKKASKINSELDFDTVQTTGLNAGLVDNKICAIDEDWSGLRFVVRKADRPNWRN